MKKKIIFATIGISLFLIGLIGLMIYFGTNQSILTIRTYENPNLLPLQTGTFELSGFQGTYESVQIGCFSSSGSAGGYYINDNSDGNLAFCNSITDGQTLTLSSSNSISGSATGGTNYIQAKITLPKGNVSVSYDYSASSYYGDVGGVVFTINNEVKRYKTPFYRVAERGGSISGSDTYKLELEEETEIIFRIDTITEQKNENVVGNMVIEFDEEIEEIIIVPENETTNEETEIQENTEQETNSEEKINERLIYIISFSAIAIFLMLIIFLIVKLRRK